MTELRLTSQKLNDLKKKVKAEMLRRNATEHNASLASYGTNDWDFSISEGEAIRDEHIKKIIDPLLQIGDFKQDNSLINEKSSQVLAYEQADAFVEEMAQKGKTAADTG